MRRVDQRAVMASVRSRRSTRRRRVVAAVRIAVSRIAVSRIAVSRIAVSRIAVSRIAVAGVALLAVVVTGCAPGAAGEQRWLAPELVVGGPGRGPGEFEFPRAVAVSPEDGRFWVVDRRGRIQHFAADGALLAAWRTPEIEFGAPVGLHADRDGTLLVMDSHYQRVLRYDERGARVVASFGAQGKGRGEFTFGRDVVADSAGNIYAGDYGGDNDRVEKFTAEGEFLLEWGRQGAAPGEFDKMQGMTIERRGAREFLLIADQCNHRVQRFDLDGRFDSSFGSLGTAPGELRFPSGVAVGSDGSIYVSEWGNNRVQRFDREGRSLGVWGGPGTEPGRLKTPWDVAVGPDDRVWVADYGNHRVQVFRWGDRAPLAVSRAGERVLSGGAR